MPGIDGLRAIAVLAVFFYHVGAGWMPGGFLGVDVFFVISGFLITSLLLSELRKSGRVNVPRFWLRRARRLLPAVLVMIVVTLLAAAILVPDRIDSLRGDALASLFYVNNWHLIASDQSYFEQFEPSLFRHLWSLSVEEQFYLLWPLLFAAGISLFGRKRLLWGVLVGAAASTLLMIVLFDPGSGTDRVFYGTDTRAVGLLIGVALAMVWNPNELRMRTSGPGAGWVLDAIGLVALALIVRDFLRLHDFDSSLYRGGFSFLAVFTGVLIAVLAHPAARLGRLLGCAPLVWLGLRSYSFYLWHWPILMLTRPGIDVPLTGPSLVVLQLGATLVIADLSYRYVEQVFRLRADSPAARRRLAIGRPALAAAVAVAFAVAWSGVVPTGGGSDGAVAQAHQARVIVTGRDADGDPSQASLAKPPTVPVAQRHHRNPPSDESSGREASRPDRAVLAIGDSVMRGASTQLVSALGDKAVVDAEEGRQASAYPDLIDSYRERGELPNRVVVQEGNNGPVYWADATALKASLAGVDHVYLLNVEVPRSWEDEVNSELEQIAGVWPEAEVVDWHDAVSPEMTYDGIHVDPDGAEVYANLVAGAVNGG
jgi:peptidoglycan/LPS O-acetylase OafA/YrhL